MSAVWTLEINKGNVPVSCNKYLGPNHSSASDARVAAAAVLRGIAAGKSDRREARKFEGAASIILARQSAGMVTYKPDGSFEMSLWTGMTLTGSKARAKANG